MMYLKLRNSKSGGQHEDIKVGDRVRVDEGLGRGKGSATITSVGALYDFIVHHDDGDDWAYNKDELTLLEDEMEYTVNGVTYRQLKDITVKAFVLAGADDKYVEYFGMDYNITEQIWLRIAIDFSSRWPEKLQWLVDQGFVEVVEEALKACPFCGGEAHWQTEKRDWIACSDCKIETNVMDSTQEAISLWNKRV